MNRDARRIEGIVAAWLRWGTLAAAAICVAGLAWMLAHPTAADGILAADLANCPWPCGDVPGATIVLVGVAGLVGVSSGRLALLAWLFLASGDRAFAAVSAAGFLLTLAAAALAALGG